MGKLINRIRGLRLLISSLPGKALRTLVDIARLRPKDCIVVNSMLVVSCEV